MEHPQQKAWPFYLLFGILAVALLALGGRVVHFQSAYGSRLSEVAERQQRMVIVLPGRPGNIFGRSRRGYVLLAGSRPAPSCYADPKLLGERNFARAAEKVAAIVGASPRELRGKLLERRDRGFVYLARDLGPWETEAIRKLDMPAVRITHEWRRRYPQGSRAAHVLGFRRIDGVAGEGTELKADAWLAATDGRKVVRVDARRRGSYAQIKEFHPPRNGKHVVLTIDVMIQGFLEEALAETVAQHDAVAGMGVVMDPRSGKILAMASVPTFDPNRYQTSSPDQRRNRAITDPYEPGSVFKPIVAIGAVQLGRATLATEFFCHDGLYHAHRGGTIREFSRGFGTITMAEGIIRSSNIYMAKLGEVLGNELLHRIAGAFDFGRRTGVELPGEDPGRLVPARRWTSYATRRMPFGQGPIMVTCLQLARAFSAIANGGELLRPWIIDRVFDADGRQIHRGRRQRVRRVVSRSVAREFIDEALVNVVVRGTGKRCRLDRWQVFGKTGTGQVGSRSGYIEGAYTATFVGGAPAWRPAVVCAVSIYRPDKAKGYTGGTVSAPCVRQVLARTLPYLDVPPDGEAGPIQATATTRRR